MLACGGALALVCSGCGAAMVPRGVAVVLEGPREAVDAVARELEAPLDPSVAVRVAEVPPPRTWPTAQEDLPARIIEARRAYRETLEFDRCIALLEPPEALDAWLARGERGVAAQALAWLSACHAAAGDAASAARVARELAVRRLPLPSDLDAISPSAERILGDAQAEVAGEEASELSITSVPPGARVEIDGRARCDATPCTAVVADGTHLVRVSADGFEPAILRVEGSAPIAATLAPVSPETAADEWHQRDSAARDAWPALRSLAAAVRERRVVRLVIAGGEPLRLSAALAADDAPPRRAERSVDGEPGSAGRALLVDLLREAGVIPPRSLLEEPLLWISIAAAAALAAGITFGVLYTPDVQTELSLRGGAP